MKTIPHLPKKPLEIHLIRRILRKARRSRTADFVLLMKLYEFCAADRNVPDPKELLFNRKYYMIGVLLEQERRLNMK